MTNEETEDLKHFYQNSPLTFTDHGLERARKRFSLSKEATIRLIKDAIAYGEFHVQRPKKTEDSQSYSFVHKSKVFVVADGIDYIKSEHIAVFITVYNLGKNTELGKNYKTFIKGQPVVQKVMGGKREKNLKVQAHRKSNKHKQF